MKQRNVFVILVLAIIAIIASSFDANAQFRRKDIYDPFYSAADRHRLRQLIIDWLENDPSDPIQQHLDVIGPLPVGVHCKTATFLTWHRQYIEQLETWLMGQQDGPKFVPLPKWDPTTVIPDEFFNDLIAPDTALATGYSFLSQQDPNSFGAYNFTRFTNPATICNYVAGVQTRYCMGVPGTVNTFGTALDNLGRDLELEHNPVHGLIGGAMNTGSSPAAAIFWLWHAYVDDLYQHYLCACTGSYPAKDLYIMDNNGDIGAEPNTTTGTYYQSPEIWVRQNQDVQVGGRYTMEDDPGRHQNAEYKIAGDNYVYVRVRNKGCQPTVANEVRLRVYWSKAQTSGWVWPDDWTNTPPALPKRGDEITNPGIPLWVPPLDPGETWTAEVPWHAPDPADYPTDSYHFCLVGRLVSASDPMAVLEGTNIGTNTRNNNNIAWKNIQVRNNDPFNIIAPDARNWNTIHVRATRDNPRLVRLQFKYPANHGVQAMVELRGDLYKRWVEGGMKVAGFDYVGENLFKITAPNAYFDGLALNPKDIYTIGVKSYVEYGQGYNGVILDYGDRLNFDVQQYENYQGSTEYKLVGGNNCEIRIKQSDRTDCGKLINNNFTLVNASCPNSSNGSITLNLPTGYEYFWSTGSHSSSIQNLAPGTYWVVVRKSDNCVERRKFVVKSVSDLAIRLTSQIPRCRYANGTASVVATGGKTPYTYQWYRNGTLISGATTPNLTNMGFGTYMAAVTDAAGCRITSTVIFTDDFMQIGLSYKVTDASSESASDGAIDLTVLDGMGPFTYRWSNGRTTQDIRNLAPGQYSVSVVDHMGCVANGTVTVGVALRKNLLQNEGANSDLSIMAVVPNPVKDLAEVQYMLRYSTNVKAEVYDELGKLVATYDQGVRAPGAGSVWVTTSGLPAGRYQCRLVYRGGVSAIPFVVVR